MSEQITNDSERLARLEVEVEGMRAQFGGRFNSLESKIDLMATNLADGRKPRWDTWAAWMVVALTVVGGGTWIVNERFSTADGRADRNYELASTSIREIAAIQEKLGEVETQFRTGGQIYNQMAYRQDVLIDQLWQREFGQALKEDTPWPVLGKER
jgi:hypothetical protein